MSKRRTPVELLNLALDQTAKAVQWRIAYAVLPRGAPAALMDRARAAAQKAEDEAFVSINKVRLALGGEALPDPADPPPVRPDD